MPRSTAKKFKLGHYPESELEQLNVGRQPWQRLDSSTHASP
jgi:hypothetical protein